jgi:phosphoribosyl-AMP cyclohydrolase
MSVTELRFDAKGLIPAIIQDADTGEVLMLGYMNAWFYSRSRQKLWHKGETSGNFIKVVSIWQDCENNSLLVKAHPTGPVCHTGRKNCFFTEFSEDALGK